MLLSIGLIIGALLGVIISSILISNKVSEIQKENFKLHCMLERNNLDE